MNILLNSPQISLPRRPPSSSLLCSMCRHHCTINTRPFQSSHGSNTQTCHGHRGIRNQVIIKTLHLSATLVDFFWSVSTRAEGRLKRFRARRVFLLNFCGCTPCLLSLVLHSLSDCYTYGSNIFFFLHTHANRKQKQIRLTGKHAQTECLGRN